METTEAIDVQELKDYFFGGRVLPAETTEVKVSCEVG